MIKNELLPLQMECTLLFQSDPLMTTSLKGLESKLGKKQKELQPVLKLLVKQGIIQQFGDDSIPLFRYQEPVTIMEVDRKEKYNFRGIVKE